MSTQEPHVPIEGTTGERLRAFALNDATRERVSLLASRYWEIASYAVLVACAAVLRFWNLGARSMHHDESLHSFFGYGFTKGLRDVFTFGTANNDTYKHVPFMHGPFQFLGNGFTMWIFGDGDYQARILAASMGTALVFLPFLLRKQLGTWGALAASAFIAFSPTLLYYSRFTREDIYTAFWTLGLVVWIWRYLDSREQKFLHLAAGFMAMSFATKETTVMSAGTFIGLLDYMLAIRFAEQIRANRPMTNTRFGLTAAALVPVAWLIAITWPFTQERRAQYGLDDLPAEGDMVIVLGTLALPQYSAFVQLVLGKDWQLRAGSADLHVANAERGVAYTTVFLLIGLSAAAGVTWRVRTWLLAAAAFWVPFILLYTTFFTNMEGFMSGIWGSMDYWISQQDEARGNQPIYYYFITIPVYEFLPLALTIAGGVYWAVRGNLQRAFFVGAAALLILLLLLTEGGPTVAKAPLFRVWIPFGLVLLGLLITPMQMFDRFVLFWAVMTTLSLTVASEKMPWLNVHIALALAIVAGRFVGDILDGTDLKETLPRLERLAPYIYAGAASGLSILIFVTIGPFTLASFGAWALAVVAAVAVYWAFTGYSVRTGVQVALTGFVVAFSVFSLRAGVLASWGHPNNPYVGDGGEFSATRDYGEVPDELLVYTQSSGDIPKLRDELERIGRMTGQGRNIPVLVDASDGYTWPWAWYLRDYTNVEYPDLSDPNRTSVTPKPGQVLFVNKNYEDKLDLGGEYDAGIDYNHRRWFPEDYRGPSVEYEPGKFKNVYNARDFFGDLFSREGLGNWLDFWVRRTLPAPEPGTARAVAFFPSGLISAPPPPVSTVRTEGTQIVVGGEGRREGQLSEPSDVTLDAQGNIYVADTGNNRVNKYDAQGVYQGAIGFRSEQVTLNQPWSMTVAPDGTIFVADTWNHKILKFDASLQKVKEWGTGGQREQNNDDPLKLYGPRDIALAPNGNVLVTDTGNERVIEFTPEGDVVRQFGAEGSGGGPLEYKEPVSLAINAAGDIYVGDYGNKRIVVLDSALNLKTVIQVPQWGVSPAITDRPYITLLPDGRILTTAPQSPVDGTQSPVDGKVLTIGPDGRLLGEYTLPRNEGATFSRPIGVAADGSFVVISDSAGHVVRKIPFAEVVK